MISNTFRRATRAISTRLRRRRWTGAATGMKPKEISRAPKSGLGGRPLLGQFLAEGGFAVCDIGLVAGRIDKGIGPARLQPRILGRHAVIIAMRPQENIHRQGFQNAEGLFKILGDLRVALVPTST